MVVVDIVAKLTGDDRCRLNRFTLTGYARSFAGIIGSRTVTYSRRARHVDDQPQTESGERSFDMLHSRGVTQVEQATDLRQVPA
jgi:hypothetical protein